MAEAPWRGQAPPAPPPGGNIPGARIQCEIGPRSEPPACVQNAMMTKDKKPFTYTPGGIDLSEIRSPRMARRIERNANAPGVGDIPKSPNNFHHPSGPLPPSALAAMQTNMPVQVFPSGPPPPPPQPNNFCAPPPPPPMQAMPTKPVLTNDGVFERPDMTRIIPENPMAMLKKTPRIERKSFVDELNNYDSNNAIAPKMPQMEVKQQMHQAPTPPTRIDSHSPQFNTQVPQFNKVQSPQVTASRPYDNQFSQDSSTYKPQMATYQPESVTPQPQMKTSTAQIGSLYIPPINNQQDIHKRVATPPTPPLRQPQSPQSPHSPMAKLNQAPRPWQNQKKQDQDVPEWAQRNSPPKDAHYMPMQETSPQHQAQSPRISMSYNQPPSSYMPDNAMMQQSQPDHYRPPQTKQHRPQEASQGFSVQMPAPKPGVDVVWVTQPEVYQHPGDVPNQRWVPPQANMQQQQQQHHHHQQQQQQQQHHHQQQQQKVMIDSQGARIIPIQIEGEHTRTSNNSGANTPTTPRNNGNYNRQQSWTPTQSNAFKIIQKITNTDEDATEEPPENISNLQTFEHGPKTSHKFPETTEQVRKLNLADGESMNRFNQAQQAQSGPRPPYVRNIPVHIEGDNSSQAYVHPSEQIVMEPKKYMGSAIPSRSFKRLQAMTPLADANQSNENYDPSSCEQLGYPPSPYWHDYYSYYYPNYPQSSDLHHSETDNTDNRNSRTSTPLHWNSQKPQQNVKQNNYESDTESKDTTICTSCRNTPVNFWNYYNPNPYYPGYPAHSNQTTDSENDTQNPSNCNTPTRFDYQYPPQPYWDPYYYNYYGYPPMYPPHPPYPQYYPSDNDGYSSNDEMSYYGNQQQTSNSNMDQLYQKAVTESPTLSTPPTIPDDSREEMRDDISECTVVEDHDIDADSESDSEDEEVGEINRCSTSSILSLHSTTFENKDDETIEDMNRIDMNSMLSERKLDEIVDDERTSDETHICLYNVDEDECDDGNISETSADDIDETESIYLMADDTIPHVLSVIFEDSESVRSERESSVTTTMSEETIILEDCNEDIEDCDDVSKQILSASLPLNLTFRVCNDKEITQVTVGNSEVKSFNWEPEMKAPSSNKITPLGEVEEEVVPVLSNDRSTSSFANRNDEGTHLLKTESAAHEVYLKQLDNISYDSVDLNDSFVDNCVGNNGITTNEEQLLENCKDADIDVQNVTENSDDEVDFWSQIQPEEEIVPKRVNTNKYSEYRNSMYSTDYNEELNQTVSQEEIENCSTEIKENNNMICVEERTNKEFNKISTTANDEDLANEIINNKQEKIRTTYNCSTENEVISGVGITENSQEHRILCMKKDDLENTIDVLNNVTVEQKMSIGIKTNEESIEKVVVEDFRISNLVFEKQEIRKTLRPPTFDLGLQEYFIGLQDTLNKSSADINKSNEKSEERFKINHDISAAKSINNFYSEINKVPAAILETNNTSESTSSDILENIGDEDEKTSNKFYGETNKVPTAILETNNTSESTSSDIVENNGDEDEVAAAILKTNNASESTNSDIYNELENKSGEDEKTPNNFYGETNKVAAAIVETNNASESTNTDIYKLENKSDENEKISNKCYGQTNKIPETIREINKTSESSNYDTYNKLKDNIDEGGINKYIADKDILEANKEVIENSYSARIESLNESDTSSTNSNDSSSSSSSVSEEDSPIQNTARTESFTTKEDHEVNDINNNMEEMHVPTIKDRIRALQNASRNSNVKRRNEIQIIIPDSEGSVEDTTSLPTNEVKLRTLSTKSSIQSIEYNSEDDSGVTSDISRHISDTESEFSELRKMSRYQRAATHSRLFKLLQEQCEMEDNAENINQKIYIDAALKEQEETTRLVKEKQNREMFSRRESLSLPLRNNLSDYESFSSSEFNSPASPLSDKLVNELVRSLLHKKKGQIFRSIPIEKLQAAAYKILQEDRDCTDLSSSEEFNSYVSPLRSDAECSPSQAQAYGNNSDYNKYYESWREVDINYNNYDILPSKTFKLIQEHSDSNKTGTISGFAVKCPRVLSSKNLHNALSCYIEDCESPVPNSDSKLSEKLSQTQDASSES